MPETYQVRIVGGAQFDCAADERVLTAMERCGEHDIGVGCRGGGCGICKVRVIDGDYRTGKMSTAKVSEIEREAGYALACRLYPESDLSIEV